MGWLAETTIAGLDGQTITFAGISAYFVWWVTSQMLQKVEATYYNTLAICHHLGIQPDDAPKKGKQ